MPYLGVGAFRGNDLRARQQLKFAARKILLILSAFLAALPARAFSEGSHVKAKLLCDAEAIQPGKPFWVGVALSMEEGWHTYWKNPGDSGLPTKIEWKLPEGFKAGELLWPVPVKFQDNGNASYGYENQVMFSCQIFPPADVKARKAPIEANVRWMECSEICVPGKAKLSLNLPVWEAAEKADAKVLEQFERTAALIPKKTSGWRFKAIRRKKSLELQIIPPENFSAASYDVSFFPETPGMIRHGAPQKFARRGKSYIMNFEIGDAPEGSKRLKGILVLKDGGREPVAVEADAAVLID